MWVEGMTYERTDGQARRDRGHGARAYVSRQTAAGGQEGEEEGLGRGVGLVCLGSVLWIWFALVRGWRVDGVWG